MSITPQATVAIIAGQLMAASGGSYASSYDRRVAIERAILLANDVLEYDLSALERRPYRAAPTLIQRRSD